MYVYVCTVLSPSDDSILIILMCIPHMCMYVCIVYHLRRSSRPSVTNVCMRAYILGLDSASPVRICLGIPITSKGTKMDEIRDSPFWNNLFDSFMKSIDWRSNRYVFRFYLG